MADGMAISLCWQKLCKFKLCMKDVLPRCGRCSATVANVTASFKSKVKGLPVPHCGTCASSRDIRPCTNMVSVVKSVQGKVTSPMPKQTPYMLTETEEHSSAWQEHKSH